MKKLSSHMGRRARLAFACGMLAMPMALVAEAIPISSIEQLQQIGNDEGYPLDGDYVMTGDIDATATATWNDGAGFDPIGNRDDPFTGTFDGGGFAIDGLFINRPEENRAGLFGQIDSATITNVTLSNTNVTAEWDAGALVARGENSTIRNCHSSGTVAATSIDGYVGGLAGALFCHEEMSDCSSSSNVSGGYYLGGLVGYYFGSESSTAGMTNCHATGEAGSDDPDKISFTSGGLVGAFVGSMSGCSASGRVYARNSAGGLIAHIPFSPAQVTDSHATGDVWASSAGGFLAWSYEWYMPDSFIERCYATGNVTSTFVRRDDGTGIGGEGATGGFAVGFGGEIRQCFATGDVFTITEAAGFVAWNSYSIRQSYATGNVTSERHIAGFDSQEIDVASFGIVDEIYTVGHLSGSPFKCNPSCYISWGELEEPITNSGVFNIETSGELIDHLPYLYAVTGIGLSTVQMTRRATYEALGWDFENVWTIDEGVSYPYFQWQESHIPLAPTATEAWALY